MCAQRSTASTSQPPSRDRDRDHSLESYPSFGMNEAQSNIITAVKREYASTKGSTPIYSSNRSGSIDGKYRETFRKYDTIKQAFSSTNYMNEQFQTFFDLISEKLGVSKGPFETAKEDVIRRIDELLKIYKQVGRGMLGNNDQEIEELRKRNDEYKTRITLMEQAFENSRDLFSSNKYVFKKSSLVSLLQGAKLKADEMAHVEKMHIDYKEKKVVIEYNLDEKSLREGMQLIREDSRVIPEIERVDRGRGGPNMLEHKARALWKSSTRIAKQFVKLNYFMVYNITDMYRLLKDKNAKSPSLSKIYSDLEGKEKGLEKLKNFYKEQEEVMSREQLTKELLERTNPFLVEFLTWFDKNFELMKDIYQNLSKEMIAEINEGKLQKEIQAAGRKNKFLE